MNIEALTDFFFGDQRRKAIVLVAAFVLAQIVAVAYCQPGLRFVGVSVLLTVLFTFALKVTYDWTEALVVTSELTGRKTALQFLVDAPSALVVGASIGVGLKGLADLLGIWSGVRSLPLLVLLILGVGLVKLIAWFPARRADDIDVILSGLERMDGRRLSASPLQIVYHELLRRIVVDAADVRGDGETVAHQVAQLRSLRERLTSDQSGQKISI